MTVIIRHSKPAIHTFSVIVMLNIIGKLSLFWCCFARHIFAKGKNVAGGGKEAVRKVTQGLKNTKNTIIYLQ
jgi:hypothetical protein